MVFIIGVLIVKLYEKIKANNDNFTIKIPIFGELILSNLRIGIYESLFLLINNGVPITTAIENIIYDCKSKFIKEVLNKVLIDIRNGKDLTVALNKKYIFDIDYTILIPDWSKEDDYFKLYIPLEEQEEFFKCKQDILNKYERDFPKYNTKTLSDYFGKYGFTVTEDVINGWMLYNGETIVDEVVDGT